jgi:hypothetical protein
MYMDLKGRFWWSNMKRDVAEYIALCDVCNRVNDKVSIATTPNILPPHVQKLGQFCFQVPPEDDVKPNFRTPPKEFHVCRGDAAKDI